MSHGKPLVRALRNEWTESVHLGHIAVADAQGAIQAHAGEPEHVTFLRSTAKPLQAIPLLEEGGADEYGLVPREIAVICASHGGERAHREAVQAILDKIGAKRDQLRCGAHPPWDEDTARRLSAGHQNPDELHNNCSGKHAGMLALARLLQADSAHYDELRHPVQQRMLRAVAAMAGVPADTVRPAVDGCGAPVFGMPLRALARAYARLGSPQELPGRRRDACGIVIDALRREPFYLAGTGRYDTALIRATGGRVIGKMGAEGLFAATVPAAGIGIAVKIADGAERAVYPAVTEALKQLKPLSDEELARLAAFHHPPLRNHRGDIVGRLQPAFELTVSGG